MHINLNRFLPPLLFCSLGLIANSQAMNVDEGSGATAAPPTLAADEKAADEIAADEKAADKIAADENAADEIKEEHISTQTQGADVTSRFPDASYWEGKTFYASSWWVSEDEKTTRISIVDDEGISYTVLNSAVHVPACETGIMLLDSPQIGDPVFGVRIFEELPTRPTDKLYTLIGGKLYCDEAIEAKYRDEDYGDNNDEDGEDEKGETGDKGETGETGETGEKVDDDHGEKHVEL